MNKDFITSYKIKNTYVVNQIIYSLTKFPFLGKFVSTKMYGMNGLKIFGNIVAVIREIIKIFGYKIMYLFAFFIFPMGVYSNSNEALFIHIYLCLALIGAFSNTEIFNPTKDKYYMLILMKMNAKRHTLSHFVYFLSSIVIGQLTAMLVFARHLVSWQYAIVLVITTVMMKCSAIAFYLYRMKRTNTIINENKPASWPVYIGLMAGGLLLAYGLPYINLILPVYVYLGIGIILILIGVFSYKRIASYDRYHILYRKLLNNSNLILEPTVKTNAVLEINKKQISVDGNITSDKEGYAYFHDLFVKRHRKLLKDRAIKTSIVITIVAACIVLGLVLFPEFKTKVNTYLLTMFSYVLLFMYFINTGSRITNAMFMNCDHSMLTYKFYRQSKALLSLFRKRMLTVITINLSPAVVLGVALCVLLYVSGGAPNQLNYLVIILSTVAISIFFSVHHLIIYYLLQPYNISMEMKSVAYTIVNGTTYWLAYFIAGLNFPTMMFGSIMIIFAALYSAISLFLVYRFAPKTFKLK